MDCEHALELINARIDGEISAAESAELDAHLSQCAACRAEAESLRAARDFMSAHGRVTSPPDLATAVRRLMEDSELVDKRPALASIVPLPTRLRHTEEPAHTPAAAALAREPRARRGLFRSNRAVALAAGFMVCALVGFMAYFVVNFQKTALHKKNDRQTITTAENQTNVPAEEMKSDSPGKSESGAEHLTLNESEENEDTALMEYDETSADTDRKRAAEITADKRADGASAMGEMLAMTPGARPAPVTSRGVPVERARTTDAYKAIMEPAAPAGSPVGTAPVRLATRGFTYGKPLELILRTQSADPANLQQIAIRNITSNAGTYEIKDGRIIMQMEPVATLNVLNFIKEQAGPGANVTVPERLLNNEAAGAQQRMIQTEIVFEEQAPAPATEAEPAEPATDSE